MKFSNGRTVLFWLLLFFSARPAACAGAAEGCPPFKAVLAEAGLAYSGSRPFVIVKDNRRGSWKGGLPAFRTLALSDGAVRLRLEMTKNISRARAEKTMTGRFLRIDALYSGAAAYPGMVTTEFEVPAHLRPKEVRTGPGAGRVKMLAATPGLAYGAGAEDLVSHRGLLGYVYCENSSLLAQIELFVPKAEFRLETALDEFDRIGCGRAERNKAR